MPTTMNSHLHSVNLKLELLEWLLENTDNLAFVQDANMNTLLANQATREFLGTDAILPDVTHLTSAMGSADAEQAIVSHSGTIYSNQTGQPAPNSPTSVALTNSLGEQHIMRCLRKEFEVENSSCVTITIFSDVTELTGAKILLEKSENELTARILMMEALNAVTGELVSHRNLSSLLKLIADNTCIISDADYSYVTMVHSSNDYMETVATSGIHGLNSAGRHTMGNGIAGECWRTGEVVSSSNYQEFPNKMKALETIEQACGIPITIEDEVIGVLGVAYNSRDVEIKSQLDLLEKFAQLASLAIENNRLNEKNKLELSQTEAVSRLSNDMYDSSDLSSLVNAVCKTVVQQFNASLAQIFKVEQAGYCGLTAWTKDGEQKHLLKSTVESSSSISVSSWCIKNRESAFIPRYNTSSQESASDREWKKRQGFGSCVYVPLVHNDVAWGYLCAHRDIELPDFTEHDVNLLKVVGSQTSVALHRQDLMHKIQHRASHDSLTELPNRYQFENILNSMLDSGIIAETRLAVLFIDLDGFKMVNDSLGHSIGDKLLQLTAQRFRRCLTSEDTLARLGGDEFAVLVTDYNSNRDIKRLAQHLIDTLAGDILIDGANVRVSASAGISFYPDHGDSGIELIKNADIAMYGAKNSGKGVASVFNHEQAERYATRLDMVIDLKRAVDQNQFELYYQPKVSCETQQIVGFEALLRWKHPEKGFVSPMEFIPVAEECGLIQRIGTWVIDEACRQGSIFMTQDIHINIAVNISAQQFCQSDFVETVSQTLQKHQFPAKAFELELTESVVMHNVEEVIQRLATLRGMGIKIAIDDFGTGYSSLAYLEDLPLDVLKIDKAFVDKLNTTNQEKSLVKTIVLMANSFGLTTVAEGVETDNQVAQISQLGCDQIQGYYYSKPVPANELPEMLLRINSASEFKLAS